jgi:hypothetical protein
MSKHHHDDSDSDLVALHLDYGATSEFVYATLFALSYVEDDPSVVQYCRADPAAQKAILALTSTVGHAGIRVRDSNPKRDDVINDHLDRYTPEEIWMADLAIDVLAMFATGGGLNGSKRSFVQDHLKRADEHTHNAHWKRHLHKAGSGVAEFRELRAHVPPRRK